MSHPFEGCVFDGFEAAPWSVAMDHLGFVKAVDRLGESMSYESPTLPTEGSMPASARRSVQRMDTYCDPRSL